MWPLHLPSQVNKSLAGNISLLIDNLYSMYLVYLRFFLYVTLTNLNPKAYCETMNSTPKFIYLCVLNWYHSLLLGGKKMLSWNCLLLGVIEQQKEMDAECECSNGWVGGQCPSQLDGRSVLKCNLGVNTLWDFNGLVILWCSSKWLIVQNGEFSEVST